MLLELYDFLKGMEHIKITCEYCGTSFYIEKHDVCPNCGASYADNAYLKSKKKEQEEDKKAREERRRQEREVANLHLEEMRKKNAFLQRNREMSEKMNKGCFNLGKIIVAIFFFVVIIGVGAAISDDLIGKKQDETTTAETTTEIPLVKVEANFGEEADAGRYSFKIDKIEKTTYYPWDGKKDHTCILIHALLTSHLDRSYNSDIYAHVIADGIAQRSFFLPNGYSGLPKTLPKGLTIEGWYRFEIPDDAEQLEFDFGDYIVIHFTSDDIS